ncbi:beta-glucuronidase [Aestuariibaculum sp. M13]|uniref:sugar-binding domain-containing protein n=1 Tax=Aestuariibaculum sp. M13 TaxID=2967132 RepID=UPI002159E425|nr:sugar-binding domain-containing protein [Aestuariibaculum sp. M13]MCR8668925.1 beta-glucuronidase [Aestuariibaculum sp. M13]
MIFRNIKALILLSLVLAGFQSCENPSVSEIDLSGDWNFKIDTLDEGVSQNWFELNFEETVKLPGSMAENGKGHDVSQKTVWTGNMDKDKLWYENDVVKKHLKEGVVKVPFCLTPVKEYVGPAWYQKTVTIPEAWNNKRIVLNLERVHWESMVWVNGKQVGMQNSLGTSHQYILTDILTSGNHKITIRVDNRIKDIDVGLDAHSVSDNTQSNWNGIVGDISLKIVPKLAIGDVKIYPNIKDKSVKVLVDFEGKHGVDSDAELMLQVNEKSEGGKVLKAVSKKINQGTSNQVELVYPMGDHPQLWDEFNPNLYDMKLTLNSVQGKDEKCISFGMREFKANGTVFTINERPVFLRGTLECAIFPLTGYPPTDVDSWKRIMKTVKNFGLNHIRFHSWCPPEAAFQAADELGVYLQVEASAWTFVGNGAPIDQWLYEEGEAMLNAYGNHPSFVMMAYGNEPFGKNHKNYLAKFVDHFKSIDNRRLYTGGGGWPYLENQDFYDNAAPRIQLWNQNLESVINKYPPQTNFDYDSLVKSIPMPYVTHEMGQWCAYPNFKEMSKYTGVLKPRNFEIFQETLIENGMGELADEFLLASGKLQTLCYKADIEAALRTKNLAGFQLLDLHDFPGQGTALVGVLDAFWDEKGYVTSDLYSKFCNQTVPLARLEKRIYSNTDTLKASIEIAHFGKSPLVNAKPKWKLTNMSGQLIEEGRFAEKTIDIGNGIALGEVVVPLSKSQNPEKLILSVQVTEFENTWDVWVYPIEQTEITNENSVKVVHKLDKQTIEYLKNGGKVLFNISKGDILPEKGGDIAVGFSSIFWNTSWTLGQKPHTLGILCDPKHPALEAFPTEYHSNWQWWDAMSHSNAIVLDEFPKSLKPIVRVIDDWFQNRRTALLIEAKVGKGSLLMSGIDLHTNINERLEAKQLLYSLKKYMTSNQFNPDTALNIEDITSLLVK